MNIGDLRLVSLDREERTDDENPLDTTYIYSDISMSICWNTGRRDHSPHLDLIVPQVSKNLTWRTGVVDPQQSIFEALIQLKQPPRTMPVQ